MKDLFKKFLEVWNYQQGAVFLKQDEIYAHRQNLAQFFYEEGYKNSLNEILHLKSANTLLNGINLDIMNKNMEYREALEKIADVTSAFSQNRKVSYSDFELRQIAKKALDEKTE